MNESVLNNSVEGFEFNDVILAKLPVLAKGNKRDLWHTREKQCTVCVLVLCQSEFLKWGSNLCYDYIYAQVKIGFFIF